MFLPYPIDFQSFSKTPVVWILLAFNFFGFLSLLEDGRVRELQKFLTESQVIIYIGETYFDEILNQDRKLNELGSSALTTKQKVWIGTLALRDDRFMQNFENFVFTEDTILNQKIKADLGDFKTEHLKRKSQTLGLHSRSDWKSYLTYQLSHVDFLHLLSNMVFLLGIGFFLEVAIGSLGFTLLYLMCGIFGGVVFHFMNPYSFIPMIGASGSISGLMIFYAFYEKRKHVRFAFFVSPFKEHHGFIHAPVWWIIILYMLSDLAQIVSAPAHFSTGVAYTAHAGGAIMGCALAVLWSFVGWSKSAPQSILRHGDGL